jgi:hypothetical protein
MLFAFGGGKGGWAGTTRFHAWHAFRRTNGAAPMKRLRAKAPGAQQRYSVIPQRRIPWASGARVTFVTECYEFGILYRIFAIRILNRFGIMRCAPYIRLMGGFWT